jgi:DNA-directed RNA polymerase specialized sigma24 family protein
MDAFKTLFFRYYQEFLSYSAGFLQDEVAARKVTLEAFFLLRDRYAEFDSEARVKAFLCLTIRNKCMQVAKDLAGQVASPPKDGTGSAGIG